jgi:hypothetical protein
MARHWFGLVVVFCLAAFQLPARAEDSRTAFRRAVPFSDLLGLSPIAVRARLADVPAEWPIPFGLKVSTPTGVLDFILVDDLMSDPLTRELMRPGSAGAFRYTPPKLICQETLKRDRDSDLGGQVVLVFKNERLLSAFSPTAPLSAPLPQAAGFNHSFGLPVPTSSVFIAHLGELPLEDGLGFLARLGPVSLVATDELIVACDAPSPLPTLAPTEPRRHSLTASDMQGLALLPWAVTLPGKNSRRAAAQKSGAMLLSSIVVGERLSVTPKQFAADHHGVRFFAAKNSTYGVLTIDMGGPPTNNLSAPSDSALVGVRDGRVEWVTLSLRSWMSAELLCIDDRGVPGTPRPGCWGFGQFSP